MDKKIKPIQSIRVKLIFIMIIMLGLSIFAFWFMNYTFLPSFYQNNKVSMLAGLYDSSNDVLSEDADYISGEEPLSSDSTLALEKLGANSSSNLYIFELTNFLGNIYYTFDYPSESTITDIQKKSVREKTQDYVLGLTGGVPFIVESQGREMIREREEYCIYKVMDERIGSFYIELFGRMDSGAFVYIRTNYQSMKEDVDIFNSFLGRTGIGVILVGIILMIFFSSSFTRPILQITEIAKRMSELDFDVKYTGTTEDEIGVLGSSINILSETLENTISELKTANNELQTDIENKIQIDEMRKEFLSNVSHELKTPIALIQGYAEGLQENISDDPESREFYCEVIIDEANKMNKMVKKLLTLNQIEFGKNQVSFERFDIIQMIRSVIQSATLLAEQKGANISMEDYAPVYVWADEYMTEEVVTNYVSNAINHVDGEKRISVSLENREKVVRISVFNTGKQIPEEELDKIWIKFYKVDKARTRAYGGSGIGLSIVKAIVEAMNQRCGVVNHENGVEFWFELDREDKPGHC